MYDIEHVYERIESAWKSIGCKNAKQFSEYANEHGYFILEQTISKWRKGTKPSIENLLDICNVCGCDIDYLLGKIPCMTRQITDIQKETGLSEKACKIITCNNQPDFFTENAKAIWRETELSQQGYLSWFIEHGVIDILAQAHSDIHQLNPDNSSMIFIPEPLHDMLNDCFTIALRNDIKNRADNYKDWIAFNLIGMGMAKVTDIESQLCDPLIESSDFYAFDDFVEYEADKRKLTDEERQIVADVTETLYSLSFFYFQTKYETQLKMQITVNRFSSLLDEYKQEIAQNAASMLEPSHERTARKSKKSQEKAKNANPR